MESRRVPRIPAEKESPPPKKKGGAGAFWWICLGILVAAALLAALGIYHLRGKGRERQQTGEAVQAGAKVVRAVKPTKSPPGFEFSLPGSAEALTTATLYARVNGYLKARTADIGDRVEEGQLLAVIDAPDIDAQLSQSRAQLDQNRAAADIARVTFERQKRLVDQRVVSRQDYDQAEANNHQAFANVKASEAAVQNLTVQQNFTRIVAPFAGVVTTRYLNDGALISDGGGTAAPSIFTVAQIDTLRVFINVPQAYAPSVKPGQEVGITLPEYPNRTFKGRVTRTANALDATARTERVEIQLPSEDGALLPGMFLSVKFRVEQATPALIVPADTVEIRKEGPRVAVVQEGKIAYRNVVLGRDFGKTIEVVKGVTEADALVVNPTPELVEGLPVTIMNNEAKKASSPK